MSSTSTEGLLRPSSAFGRRASILTEAIDTLLRCYAVSRARSDMSRLDDRMLEDIGITRADVEYERRKPFWKL